MRHMKDAQSSIVKENGEEWKMHVRFLMTESRHHRRLGPEASGYRSLGTSRLTVDNLEVIV